MFSEMRRKERELGEAEAKELLTAGEYGITAFNGDNGYPSALPVNYAYDREGDCIYIHRANEGYASHCLRLNGKVCFTVIGSAKILPEKFSTLYTSVMAFGTAGFVEGDEKLRALNMLIRKYSKGFEKEGEDYIRADMHKCCVVRINIEHLSCKGRKN